MKYSIIFWVALIITAVILCNIFPIIKHDPITYLIFVYVVTRFYKFVIFRKVPAKYRFENNEVAIVTGSSSGIGCQIAEQLCRRGAKVVWSARDVRKAQNALNDIFYEPKPNSRGYVLYMDLASLESIRKFVDQFKSRENRLNVLVLNAAYHGPYRLTKDNFEQTTGVNHLGHMYLCYLLMDLLKSSPAPNGARIVVVSSDLHKLCKDVHLGDLMFQKDKGSYRPWSAYNRSKLLNILFVNELSRRLKAKNVPVTVHAAHPGTPVYTELMRDDNVLSSLAFNQLLMRPLGFFYCRSTFEAAQTPMHACLAPECSVTSGKYFENCSEASTNKIAQDERCAQELWDISCDLLKIDKNWL